jgi:predicted membrane metal-binding protein
LFVGWFVICVCVCVCVCVVCFVCLCGAHHFASCLWILNVACFACMRQARLLTVQLEAAMSEGSNFGVTNIPYVLRHDPNVNRHEEPHLAACLNLFMGGFKKFSM